MNIRTRLSRRPVTTILWTLLFAAAALSAVLGVSAAYAAARLPSVLVEYHTTVAVQAWEEAAEDGPGVKTALFEPELEALKSLPMVQSADLRTLTGAVIPELTGRIGLKPWGKICVNNVDYLYPWDANTAYERVMAAGTVIKAWTSRGEDRPTDLSALGGPERANIWTNFAVLRVEELIAAQPDLYFFPTEDYTDYNGTILVRCDTLQANREPWFQEGERYVVQGWLDPACSFTSFQGSEPPADLQLCPQLFCDRLLGALCAALAEEDTLAAYADVTEGPEDPMLRRIETLAGRMPLIRRLEGSAETLFAADPAWAAQREEAQTQLHTFPVLGTECLESVYQFVTGQAVIEEGRFFTREEYESGAKLCVLSRTLAESGGIRVGDQISLSQFLLSEGWMNGKNHSTDPAYNSKSNNPSVGEFPFAADQPHEVERFTVVGLYRQENEWENGAFSFTPNTVFIPQKAQLPGGYGGLSQYREDETWVTPPPGGETIIDGQPIDKPIAVTIQIPMERGVQGVYFSLVLENGSMEDFQTAVAELTRTEPGLENHRFLTFDQGYEGADRGIAAIAQAGFRLLLAISAGALMVLLAYLLFCQGRQRQALGIMRSVGASRSEARRWLFGSGWVPPALGILLGTGLAWLASVWAGRILFSLIVDQAEEGVLGQTREAYLKMLEAARLPWWAYFAAAGSLLLIGTLLLWIHAAFLSRKSIRKLLT